MVDACFQGIEQSDVGDETERFPRLSYGRHVIEVQKNLFNNGYKGKFFFVQAKVIESSDPAKNAPGETRTWGLKMNSDKQNVVDMRKGELALYLGTLLGGFTFPQDKARFDAEFLPRISSALQHACPTVDVGASPETQPCAGTRLRCSVSWQSAKGDPMTEGFPVVKFYPMSVPAESVAFVSPPPGYRPYTKPGTAPAYQVPPAPTAYAPPAAQWSPPPPPPPVAAQPWSPPPGAYQAPPPVAAPPIDPGYAAYLASQKR